MCIQGSLVRLIAVSKWALPKLPKIVLSYYVLSANTGVAGHSSPHSRPWAQCKGAAPSTAVWTMHCQRLLFPPLHPEFMTLTRPPHGRRPWPYYVRAPSTSRQPSSSQLALIQPSASQLALVLPLTSCILACVKIYPSLCSGCPPRLRRLSPPQTLDSTDRGDLKPSSLSSLLLLSALVWAALAGGRHLLAPS